MIKYTCVKPNDRFRSIASSFQTVFRYYEDEYLISINKNMNPNCMLTVERKRLKLRIQYFTIINKRYLINNLKSITVSILTPVSIKFHKRKQSQTIKAGRCNFVGRSFQDVSQIIISKSL